MAIARKLLDIQVTITDATGTVVVDSDEMVTDDVEGISGGRRKRWNAPAVVSAAAALRDAVIAQAAGQSKPMTF